MNVWIRMFFVRMLIIRTFLCCDQLHHTKAKKKNFFLRWTEETTFVIKMNKNFNIFAWKKCLLIVGFCQTFFSLTFSLLVWSSENRVCLEREVFFYWSFCRAWFLWSEGLFLAYDKLVIAQCLVQYGIFFSFLILFAVISLA